MSVSQKSGFPGRGVASLLVGVASRVARGGWAGLGASSALGRRREPVARGAVDRALELAPPRARLQSRWRAARGRGLGAGSAPGQLGS